jgi:anti-sigma28 factor (negative regulator of flagellin synthesis)
MEDNNPAAEKFAESLGAIAAAIDTPASKHSEERIAELRRLYQSGEYRPKTEDIASKLIDEHLS